MFKKIKLGGWRQFRNVEVEFHPRLTVITGANGAGKTTLLTLASRHFGWNSQYVGTPARRNKDHTPLYSSDFWFADENFPSVNVEEEEAEEDHSDRQRRHRGSLIEIGTISYSVGSEAVIGVPAGEIGSVYNVEIVNQQQVDGLHIPSHRAAYQYQQVQNIPTVPRRRNEVFNHYINLIRTRFTGGHTQWSPQHYMKETLIALATFGYGNQAVDPDIESQRIFEDFQDVLRKMLPPKLGFRRLIVRVPEIVLDTDSGQFSFDALSGGASAVVDLAWQIFMYQPSKSAFVVTLDEPENHLHPELQRRVLADLISAFPHVQFIVATHSPFIVGSVPESNVYVLDYDETNHVSSSLLDIHNRAGTANEILREVLGLEFTLPIWVERRLETVVEKYAAQEFSDETLTALRREMETEGMGRLTQSAIAKVAQLKEGT